MSVNLFGTIRTINAFLPLIRKSQGRIVNVSSIMDRLTSPFSGCYTITKGAIESYSAILRLEMKRFNVQVVVIEPGNFMAATNINKSNTGEDTCQSRRLWDQLDEKIKKRLRRGMFPTSNFHQSEAGRNFSKCLTITCMNMINYLFIENMTDRRIPYCC
jgi:NAD(P)-dependent dehydrogenase (short-subunit alcohol dehydrogenase family)